MISLGTAPPPAVDPVPSHEDDAVVLHDRMQKPQRHRLLHGYPLAAAMHRRGPSGLAGDLVLAPRGSRGLLVGVLPHPFCNPTVAGCGFCTFPHETHRGPAASAVVASVCGEIEDRARRQPALQRRPVKTLYFGGGTANLAPAGPFRQLCRRLASTFDLSQAEVTLEGVPAYFVKRKPLLVDVLREEIPAQHFRLSMGIQSFDENQLRRMGRLAFGTAETFAEVVELAHGRGWTVSGDLLFNLPGQNLAEMRQDVARAAACGLDHLGLYHLVLFRGLGTAWSREPDLLEALPANVQAADNWQALRGDLLSGGFEQTTLTNFERADLRGKQRFLYEELSFQPDRFDMLGFGPSAISCACNPNLSGAWKSLNPDGSADYLAAVASRGPAWDRCFSYEPRDVQVFYSTRRLAGLDIEREVYQGLFGSDPVDDFPREFAALAAEGLIEVTSQSVRPTARGMFYADSIAALLARRQVRARRSQPRVEEDEFEEMLNDNGRGHM